MGIQTVAVIGAGTMGAGIAQTCVQSGWTTNLYDAFPEGLEKGRSPRPQGRSFKFGKKADPESPRKGDGARW